MKEERSGTLNKKGVIDGLSDGKSLASIAQAHGADRTAIYRWKQTDEFFSEAVDALMDLNLKPTLRQLRCPKGIDVEHPEWKDLYVAICIELGADANISRVCRELEERNKITVAPGVVSARLRHTSRHYDEEFAEKLDEAQQTILAKIEEVHLATLMSGEAPAQAQRALENTVERWRPLPKRMELKADHHRTVTTEKRTTMRLEIADRTRSLAARAREEIPDAQDRKSTSLLREKPEAIEAEGGVIEAEAEEPAKEASGGGVGT